MTLNGLEFLNLWVQHIYTFSKKGEIWKLLYITQKEATCVCAYTWFLFEMKLGLKHYFKRLLISFVSLVYIKSLPSPKFIPVV